MSRICNISNVGPFSRFVKIIIRILSLNGGCMRAKAGLGAAGFPPLRDSDSETGLYVWFCI